jgi:hypothetical protein
MRASKQASMCAGKQAALSPRSTHLVACEAQDVFEFAAREAPELALDHGLKLRNALMLGLINKALVTE